jgi:hypothetical protein
MVASLIITEEYSMINNIGLKNKKMSKKMYSISVYSVLCVTFNKNVSGKKKNQWVVFFRQKIQKDAE